VNDGCNVSAAVAGATAVFAGRTTRTMPVAVYNMLTFESFAWGPLAAAAGRFDIVLICNLANAPFALVPRLTGAKVALTARGEDALKAVAADVERRYGKGRCVTVTGDDAAVFIARLTGGALATFEATRFATTCRGGPAPDGTPIPTSAAATTSPAIRTWRRA